MNIRPIFCFASGSQAHLACCCLLMRRGADVNAVDEDGRLRSHISDLIFSAFKQHCRVVLQLLLLGGMWDDCASEAVAMAIQCGAHVSACDSMGNTALAAAIASATVCLSPDVDAGCPQYPSLEMACHRLLQEGGDTAIPRHSHIQVQQDSSLPVKQLPLLMASIRLGWKQLTVALVLQGAPLHPAKEILLALCRCQFCCQCCEVALLLTHLQLGLASCS